MFSPPFHHRDRQPSDHPPWFAEWTEERASSPGPTPTCVRTIPAWEDAARSRDGPHALEDSFGLTAEGCRALRSLGCRHDADFLVLLMREARDGVEAIAAWLAMHAPHDDPEQLASNAWWLAHTINERMCRDFYDDALAPPLAPPPTHSSEEEEEEEEK